MRYTLYAWKPGRHGTPDYKHSTLTRATGARGFINLKQSGKYDTIELVHIESGECVLRHATKERAI